MHGTSLSWSGLFSGKKTWPNFTISHATLLIETSESIKVFNQISNVPSNWKIQWHIHLQCHELRNFNFKYILSAESESISTTNRPDINSPLRTIRQENIIFEFIESGKQAFSNHFSSTIDYLKYTKSSAFVSLEASMILQEKTTNIQIIVLLENRYNQPVSINFFKYWYSFFYICQNMTLYGVIFPSYLT